VPVTDDLNHAILPAPRDSALTPDCTFVLGAQDPEMREIERVVASAGHAVVYAAQGRYRVNTRTAYQADSVLRIFPGGAIRPTVLLPKSPIVTVECRIEDHEPIVKVDHHNPGDRGYEIGPDRYMEGASLGQVLALLGREPTETQRLLAAGDHCLTAAYQGECDGAPPDRLLELRASWQARVSGRRFSEVIGGILDAAVMVRARFDPVLGESRFLDPLVVPRDLPEGAAYAGLPVRYRALMPDGVVKEMFKGAAPDAIERFMQAHREAGRLAYGNPYRGYAGAYWEP
jgi:hypothetical protein